MDVADAIKAATEWVESYSACNPEFRGAHLMGGINLLPRDAAFPATSDLDISILVESASEPQHEPIEEYYGGVAIEWGPRSVELYRSPEVVLANPDQASNLAVDSILSDPYGLLRAIQPIVAAEYRRPHWVAMRCEWEKQQVLDALGRMAQANTPAEFMPEVVSVLVYLAGLVTVASLRPPTHRGCLVLLRELLDAEGRNDLYEETLSIAGFAHVSADQVMKYQQHQAVAFDRAAAMKRTSFPFDFKLLPHLRAYVVDGPDAMIKKGNHREAMPWVGYGLYMCTMALRNDGPVDEGAQYVRISNELLELLGVDTPASRWEKLHKAVTVKDSLFALADQIVIRLRDDTPMTPAIP